MEVTFNLEPRDIRIYRQAAWRRGQKQRTRKDELVSFLVVAVAAVALWIAIATGLPRLTGAPVAVPELLLGAVLGALAIMAVRWEGAQSIFRRGGPVLSQHHVTLADDGVAIRGKTFDNFYRWAAIEDIWVHGPLVILWLEPGAGLLVPRRVFPNPEAERSFVEEARSHLAPGPQST